MKTPLLPSLLCRVSRLSRFLSHSLLVAAMGGLAAVGLRADTLLSTSTFSYTGGTQGYTTPSGTDYIIIKVWGAGGGSGIGGLGGGGGYVRATFAISGGQSLTVAVGGGGSGFSGTSGGWPDGGGVGTVGGAQGAGGGSTAVYNGLFSIRAGGGGGGAWSQVGGGGGTPDGGAGGGAGGGGGATQSAVGSGGDSNLSVYGDAGSGQTGGNGADDGANFGGGGGGGGYYGGGGGGLGYGGPGGGGSSGITGSPTSSSYSGSGDPSYPGSPIGEGGYGTYVDGYPGYAVILAYQVISVFPPTSVSASSVGSYSVSLTWGGATATAGINHYNIYRNGSLLGSASGTTYSDTTASAATSYSYVIKAVDNNSVISAASSALSVTTATSFELSTPPP